MKPLGLAMCVVVASCALLPAEVHGSGAIAVALLAALAAAAAAPRSAGTTASRLVWLFVPLALVAIRASIAPGACVTPVAWIVLAAAAGLAATAVPRPVATLPWIAAGLVAIEGSRALYESIWGLAHWADRLREVAPSADAVAVLNRLEQGRPYGGFATPAALGGFLALMLPAVAAWSLGERGRTRLAGLACAAVGALGLASTRSVGALGALAAALALAGLRGRVGARLVAAVAAFLGVCLLVAGLARPDAVFAPFRPDSPWRLRAGNVRIAAEIARDHPLFGVGPGAYAEAFPAYRKAADNESRHAHDLPAELLAEWGLPVGAALTAIFFTAFLGPLWAGRGAPRTFASGAAIGLAAFALHNLVDFTAFLPSALVLACVMRGLVAAEPSHRVAPVGLRTAWVLLALAAGVVVTGSGLARDALHEARRAASAGDHGAALTAARRGWATAPWDADLAMFAAQARMAQRMSAEALDDCDRAVRLAPERAAARALRARARLAVEDPTGAYADLVEATRLYPANEDYAARRDETAAWLRNASAGASP
jgi:tetratricopeptide (TPR) repeat protein